ncbi:hypothetical protein Patl1_35317 [Pistacia atlantica]|nr:hypothetical protein Patl1_35317 [Pistacia atlantica]
MPQHLKGQQQISFTRTFVASVCDSTSSQSNSVIGEISSFTYSQQNMRDYMAKYVVATNQPFLYDEDPILEWYVQNSVQPTFMRVPRNTLKTDIFRIYN